MSDKLYIRRSNSSLSRGEVFRRRRRRSAPALRWVLLLLIGVGLVALWQRDRIQPLVLALAGVEVTPTPTLMEAAHQGDLAFWRGDLTASIQHYRAAASIDPSNVDIGYELVRMHIYRSYDDERNLADIDEAVRIADELVEANPRDQRAAAIQCYAYLRDGRSEEAAQICNRVISQTPNDPNAYAYLALAYNDLLRYEDAFEAAQRALQLDPNHLEANTAYGFLLAASRRFDQAIDYLKQAAAYNPRLQFPYYNLAVNALGVGLQRGDEAMTLLAINAYDTVLSMNKRSVKAYTSLCRAYFAIGERNLARDNCRTAADIDPAYSPAWRSLGEVHYRLSEYEEAVVAFDTCLKLDQSVPPPNRQSECWYYHGLSYVQMGDCSRAMPIFNDVLSWTSNARAVELSNEGVRICGGVVVTTPTPSPTSNP